MSNKSAEKIINPHIIVAPNFTQIPNVIFDHWMLVLSPCAFKVLLCMCRKIFGWHKTSDTISKNQIMKVTGISKNSVQSSIEELEKHGLILKFHHKNEYGNQPNTYCLNIKKPEDEIFNENVKSFGGDGSNFDPGVGQILTQGVGQILTPQKKDYTKERLTKGIAQAAAPLRKKAPQISFSFEERKFIHIEDRDLSQWKEIYSWIDINVEIKRMVEWCISNLNKSEPRKLWRKFINNWLSSENQKAINKQAYRSNNLPKSNSSSLPTVDTQNNKKLADMVEFQYRSKTWGIASLSDCVQFYQTGSQSTKVEVLNFTEPKFKERLEYLMGNKGFIRKTS